MKVYETNDIRNVALVGHGHSGKTSLVAGMLFTAGATQRFTKVDEGNTITDFDEEEIARKLTISTSVAAVEWNKKKINLLDTPGYNIFILDTKSSLIGADSAFVAVDGIAGVEVQTEKVWTYADEFVLPRAIVINKLDRERANFERALESVQSVFGRAAIPIHLPIGAEKDFKGVVDLISMKAYTYAAGSGKATEGPIPADMQEAAKTAHEALVEMVAEGNDLLMEEFFATGTLPEDHIADGLRDAVAHRRIYPVLCASGLNNTGTDRLLNFALDFFPSPALQPPWKGIANGVEVDRHFNEASPLSVFVFKTIADPFAGRVSYFKVVSGVLKNDANLGNAQIGRAHV